MKKNPSPFLSLLTLLSLLLTGCAGTQATSTLEPSSKAIFNPVVSATGVIMPAQWATVAMPAYGLLVDVPVQEGQAVIAGQVLAQIDGQEAAQAKLAIAEHELASAQHDLAELIENAPILAAQAQQDIAAAQSAVIKAERNLAKTGEHAYKDDLAQASEKSIELKDDLKTAQEDFDHYATWSEDNAKRKTYKDKLDEAQRKYDDAVHKEEKLVLQKDQAQADLATAQSQLADAQKRYAKYKNGPDALDLAIAQALVDAAQANIISAQAVLEKLELHAPFAGVVSALKVRQGEWVNVGTPVLLLADMTLLRVETTDLNEIDAARVSLNNPVKVTFDALPGVELGGMVVRISPKSEEGSGVNYTVVIELKDPPAELRWGMTAFVDIEVQK
jgi:multidrug efflux pump subunit AcrA (membrane-fusion protein)